MHPKNYSEFIKSLEQLAPEASWSDALKALWFDAKGDWQSSHDIAEVMHSNMGSWIHAYLHRKEGDEWNAGYWYRQAGKPFCKLSLDDELKDLVMSLL